MLNAPLCWLGGKRRLRQQIINRLPNHTCYVEVFGGAGWVLFGKEASKFEVYNDIDGELANFFRIVKTAHRAFVRAYDWILVSRRLFKDFILKKPEDLDEIERAVRFFYLIKTSFAGKGGTFGYAKTGLSRLNLDDLYETISAVHNRLRHVSIEERSFADVIDRYDGPETVFYLDPPYYETAGYRFNLTLEDYRRLAAILRTIKGRFLLTINDHPVMREVFSGFATEEIEVGYSVSRVSEGRRKFGELMVSSVKS